MFHMKISKDCNNLKLSNNLSFNIVKYGVKLSSNGGMFFY